MRLRRGFVWAVSAAVLAVAGLSACSDDDKETLSEDEFLEQGNAICTEGNERTASIGEDLGEDPSDEEVEAAVDELADDIDGQIDDIRDLEEPEDLSDDLEAALDQAEEDLQELRDLGADIVTAEEDPFAETNELMSEIGLTVCAEG
jgi:hypothetical protein